MYQHVERRFQYVAIYGNILLEWLLKSCVGVQWIYLPDGSAHWRVITIAVLNLKVPSHKVGCRRSGKSCDASSEARQPSTCHRTFVGAGVSWGFCSYVLGQWWLRFKECC